VFWKNFIFTYEIVDHGSKTFATDFDPSVFETILTTNFIGAANEIAKLRKLLNQKYYYERVRDFLTQGYIEWYNIPPNFGGLWGSAVKSIKSSGEDLDRLASILRKTMY